jgi:hypothetical protein
MADQESTFDAANFLDNKVEGESETRYTPIPEDDYVAMISDDALVLREINDSPAVDVIYVIDAPELAEQMQMERISVRQTLFLDIDADGTLAFGPNQNVKLGKLRDALGQNKASQKWNFRMMEGAGPVKIRVGKRPDKNDPTVIYNDVKAVTSMG